MDNHDKQSGHLSLVEAVETLSEIADMDLEHGIGIAQRHDMVVSDERLSYRTVHWLNKDDAEKGLGVIKETFRVILNYLRQFYREESSSASNDYSIEGIKTIMVLVGEAAKKLDKYTHLFHITNTKSVMELKEYKKLQEFYQARIANKIDEGKLGRWLLALSKSALTRKKGTKLVGIPNQQARHVFVDLDSVKKDSEYELFFMRKDDGARFFSPRLLRNMKLVSDFGSYFGEKAEDDPLGAVAEWRDRYYQECSKDILAEVGNLKDRFFREAFRYKDNELVQALSNCLMALMMGSNGRNSIKLDPLKSCTQYFADFQTFLREGLHTREYVKLITYPPKRTNKVGVCLLNLVNVLCKGLYLSGSGHGEMDRPIQNMLDKVRRSQSVDQQSEKKLWSRLNNDYAALAKMFKGHQNAPLVKILDALQDGNCRSFDPLSQQTMQSQLFYLQYDHRKVLDVRMGCPIIQEYVNKAVVNDEFKGFLRSCHEDSSPRNILLINLQDRTSWKDHCRCSAMEELQNHADFGDSLAVVTLAKDTDFYHQLPPYDSDNKAEAFINHYREHFGDESSGYYFPEPLQGVLNRAYFDGVVNAIHSLFYNSKNMLLRDPRLDFIEIFDVILVLKIIETAQPDSFSLICKDGVDLGAAMNAMLYSFLKIVNSPDALSEKDWVQLNLLLHAPAMMVRERLILQDRFARFISALKTIEAVKDELGADKFVKEFHKAFSPFFKTSILKATIVGIKE